MKQDTRPMTRRELRLAAERAAAPATAPTSSAPFSPVPAMTTLTCTSSTADRTASTSAALPVPQPLTRRALRLAALEQAASLPAVPDAALSAPTTSDDDLLVPVPTPVTTTAPVRLAHVPTQRQVPRDAVGRVVTGARVAKAGTVLALSAGLVTSAVALQGEDAPVLGDVAPSAADLAAERQARTEAAEVARLTAQAEKHAAIERREALAVAQAALETATTVATEAAPVVDPEIVAALDAAMVELETMVASSAVPTPPAELRAQALPTPDAAEADSADEAGEQPGSDALGREAASVAARELAPASRAVERTPLAEDATAEDETAADADASGASEDPAGAEDETTAADQPAASELGALSLEVTDQVLAAAQRVADLSAEVQAATEAKIAEAAAKAAAEAAAAAAAAELERKVAVAAASPNGRIPLDVLCAPTFAPAELLRCDAVEALEKLNAAYRADFGVDLEVVSSYRSYSAQIATRRDRGWLAAAPGTSNHGLGLAVDFGQFGGLGQFNTRNYWWMKENGPDYGWEHPRIMEPGGGGPQEPWHWEFATD